MKETRSEFGSKLVGTQEYVDRLPGSMDSYGRIFARVRFGQQIMLAMVDTGAPWCILPEFGPAPDPNGDRYPLVVRGSSYEGCLVRDQLTLLAEDGESLDIEATFFVPDLDDDESWPHPYFLGLGGFLERLTIGFDSNRSLIHFGPPSK